RPRLIYGNDQGVYSVVDNGNSPNSSTFDNGLATLSPGIGTATVADGARNGNLQIAQLFQGAVQPDVLAPELTGALFYATSQDNGAHMQSRGNLLATGFLQWKDPFAVPGPQFFQELGDTYGNGFGLATDQTGTGTVFHYVQPSNMTVATNFFMVTPPGGKPI